MNNNYETAIIHWTLKLSGLGGGGGCWSARTVLDPQRRFRVSRVGSGSARAVLGQQRWRTLVLNSTTQQTGIIHLKLDLQLCQQAGLNLEV